MLHSILLAGRPETQLNSSEDLCPLHFEQEAGVQSRFAKILSNLSSDVFEQTTVVTTQDCAEIAASQIGADQKVALLIEPECHKPAAGLLAALLRLQRTPSALVLIAHASVDFEDMNQLDAALCHAIPAAERGEIVLLGQRSARGSSGYGMLEIGMIPRDGTPVPVHRVVPAGRMKPLASLLLKRHHLTGLGVYVARVDTLLAAYKCHANRLFVKTQAALVQAKTQAQWTVLDPTSYKRIKPLSFETAVASKVSNIAAIQTDCDWSSLREWDQDRHADAALTDPLAAWDADLVAERGQRAPTPKRAAEMLALLDSLKLEGQQRTGRTSGAAVEITQHSWGSHETLAMGQGFALQRLILEPGQSVELTASASAAEHWIIVKGAALLMVTDQMKLLWQHQSARIPAGRSRRIENPGQEALQMVRLEVSVQTDAADSSLPGEPVSPAGVA